MSATVIEDDRVMTILGSALGCLCTELDRSPGGQPCFCGIIPGAQVAMDYCDCSSGDDETGCGMAWVRLDQTYVGSSVYNSVYARRALQTARCWPSETHRIQMGVTRCVPGVHADGSPPTAAEQTEAVRIQLGDRAAILRALNCCFPYDRRREFLFERYIPMGPMGNCGGGYAYFSIREIGR